MKPRENAVIGWNPRAFFFFFFSVFVFFSSLLKQEQEVTSNFHGDTPGNFLLFSLKVSLGCCSLGAL